MTSIFHGGDALTQNEVANAKWLAALYNTKRSTMSIIILSVIKQAQMRYCSIGFRRLLRIRAFVRGCTAQLASLRHSRGSSIPCGRPVSGQHLFLVMNRLEFQQKGNLLLAPRRYFYLLG